MVKKLLLLLLLVCPVWASAQVKFAHVDVDLIYHSLPEAAQIDSVYKKTGEELSAELKRMNDDYARKVTEYKESESSMSADIKQNRVEEIRSLESRISSFYQNSQKMLQQRIESLQAPVRAKINKAVDAVCQEDGYLYIFDVKFIVAKNPESIDVTKTVLQKLK